jgi:hypothetical protein
MFWGVDEIAFDVGAADLTMNLASYQTAELARPTTMAESDGSAGPFADDAGSWPSFSRCVRSDGVGR